MRDTKEAIASTNSSMQQLERDINNMKSTSSSQASLRPPPIIAESHTEQQQPPTSVAGHSSQASLQPPPIVTEPVSDSEEQLSSSVNAHPLQTSQSSLRPQPPPPIIEPVSDSEEQQLSPIDAHSSQMSQSSLRPPPIITEPVSDSEEQRSPVSMETASSTENESNNDVNWSTKDNMDLPDNTVSAGSRYELIVEAISNAEPDTGDVPTRSQRNLSNLLRLEHNYCSFESSTPRQEDTVTEPSMPSCMEPQDTPAIPSIGNEQVATSEKPTLSQGQEDAEFIVEQVIAEVPKVLVYDTAAQEPEVDFSPARQTVSLLPKKTFKKRKEPPAKQDRPSGRKRRPRKRRASARGRSPTAKRRPKNIQLLQRQHSLPASLDMQSPLGSALSRAINTALCPALSLIVSPDSYSSLTQSFQLPEVTQSQPAHSNSVPSTPSAANATYGLQNGFSSDNRVPEILTDLVTTLNTQTLTSPPHSTSTHVAHASQQGQQGGGDGVNNGGNDRVTGILSDLVTNLNTETMIQAGITSPPPVSSEQSFSSDRRVSGIVVNNLVTYLTSETIQSAGAATTLISADSANSVTAVSAISRQQEGVDVEMTMQQHTMEVEICASPLSLPTDSEVNTLTSGCEASEEYESEEEISRRREKIDADSLFHPGSNFLFTLGPEEPPLFILPRLACAGDFPLEVNPAAVSSIALDIARQGIIHASHSNDVSSDVTESELTEPSELSDGTGVGSSVARERAQTMVSTAKSQPPVIGSHRDSEELRDTTPTLEELSQSTATEEQNLPTQQTLSSDDTVPKVGESAETKKAKGSRQEKVKHSSSTLTKTVAPPSNAKPAPDKIQKSSKTGKQPAATASKATVSSGSKVKKGEEDVSVGGAKPQGPSKGKGDGGGPKLNVQMQLKMHMARLEELKGHLASKKSTPQSTTAIETSTLSGSNSQPSTSKSGAARSVASSKATAAKPTEKTAAGSSKSQQSTAMSVTGKTASTKKASAASKLGANTASKPMAAAKTTQKQGASSGAGAPSTPGKSATSKPSLTSKPTEKQAVAGPSKDSKGADDEETTCARTMGYVRKTKTAPLKEGKGKVGAKSSASAKVASTSGTAKKGTKLTVEAAMSEIRKIIKARKAESSSTSALSSEHQTVSDNLNQLWQSSQQSLLERVPHPLPVAHSTSYFLPSHRFTMSLSAPAVSEKFVAGVEKLDKPKKQVTSLHHSGGAAPLTHKHTTYHPYSSPLLVFQSYRLNPLYRTNEKLPLQSLSHSNKIDPNRIMCRFELGGICNDPSCTGQHFKDITLNKEELIQDLVCYAPQLAGCDLPETDSERLAGQPQPQVVETKGKISLYASQMVERYKKKVSDEDLFKLTVHDVNKERAKLRTDPRAKASYISFDDREWLISREEDSSSLSIAHPLSLLASEPRGQVAVQEGEGERRGERDEGESEMEWDTISKELMPLGKQRDLPRYMTHVLLQVIWTKKIMLVATDFPENFPFYTIVLLVLN